MSSTYSSRLKLELMETGANANTWGNNTNTNLETLDAFSAGYLAKSVAGSANVTLTTNNADPDAEASNKVLEFTGELTGDITVFVPAVESNYIFFNNTTGSFTLTVAPTGHGSNGVAITQGAHTIQYCTGDTIKDLFSGSLGDLTLVAGGTFTGNAAGASALNASNVSSGTINDARLTANVTLNNASTISAGTLADARLTANVTLNNASTISAGTLASDRLPTVPTTKGGTGLTSIGSAGQVLKVASPGSALEFGDAGGGGGLTQNIYNSPSTWTKPDGLSAIRVTVFSGGGGGGGGWSTGGSSSNRGGKGGNSGYSMEVIQAPSIPGPVSVTVGSGGNGANQESAGGSGGASSFGAFLSVTGGGGGNGGSSPGPGTPGTPGSGSGGDINQSGFSDYSYHAAGATGSNGNQTVNPTTGEGVGGGGGGGFASNNQNRIGAVGSAGRVIVENIF